MQLAAANDHRLKFGDPVEWKGQNAMVVGVRAGANGLCVVDLLIVREVKNGAGQVLNVVGTARQVELVHFEHDVPAEEIERAEDWFFSLNAEELDALLKEKQRRDHERLQAEQAKLEQAQTASLLQDVKIRPSDRVLQTAEKLWKDAIRAESHADEHSEIELPSYESKPDLWKPWIEKAKGFIAKQDAGSGSGLLQPWMQRPNASAPVDKAGPIPIPPSKVVACNKCGETVQDNAQQALGTTHIAGSAEPGSNCGGTFVEMPAEDAAKLVKPRIGVKVTESVN